MNLLKLLSRINRLMAGIRFSSPAAAFRHLKQLLGSWHYAQSNAAEARYQAQREAAAHRHSTEARLRAHARSCLQAYAQKRSMIGSGKNTAAGIPAGY
jgi:hypothetical protein